MHVNQGTRADWWQSFGKVLGLAAVTLILACSDGPVTPDRIPDDSSSDLPTAGDALGRAAERVGVMALAIALSEEGRALFDNFVPCVRRGIVDYRNSDKGRRVTFSGCDLGDGVVVEVDGSRGVVRLVAESTEDSGGTP